MGRHSVINFRDSPSLMYFTLCIPTMDRFEDFLQYNILNYLSNPLINEIIICDENGNDIKYLAQMLSNYDLVDLNAENKLRLYLNKQRLGPFLNKIQCCKLAKNEWIALIDSDNYANEEYFITAKDYLTKTKIDNSCNCIISPSESDPIFNFDELKGKILSKQNLNLYKDKKFQLEILMNTGNFIINKNLINIIDINKDSKLIPYISTCDVIYFNTLLFEQTDLNIHVVENLKYSHVVHDGSIYKQQSRYFKDTEHLVHDRFRNLT